ncbi:DUF3509 domain-containing protein [Phytopseudomonas dryadis]|uniref:DUF3509 domain-containing protein n=1 Tax=Phytopseudomonas dryadis TaxID=2487520 RepID=A0A4Q9R015_9GAMM|nr:MULTISPECIES: DUF3509 domain-containing protein [Pseudomonas]TBU91976.1 hypothetical protein DNK44_13680 [Pseudomonas dryadis]TBV05371.1 hypothetical protein DNK34_12550 [Pseudomonas dryadis]TBV18381.1 hypothetical protein DNK41_08340 [Pseudomonas sp. FRB 230]
MNVAIRELFAALPDHHVAITPRPDGMLLLTLSKDGEPVFVKAIERQTVICKERVDALLHEIMRDRKLVSGEISWKGQGAQWVNRKLPTFTGAPVNPTAAKMMWARRNLETGLRHAV